MSLENILKSIDELQIHQGDPQKRDDPLRHAQAELARARDEFSRSPGINARQRADHALRASEQRYEQLFNRAPICILIVDLSVTPATIVKANRRATLVYGYTGDEFRGMPVALLVPEDARPATLTMVEQVRSGITVTTETVHQHRDGNQFHARVDAALDPTDVRRMIVTIEDTTVERLRRGEAEAIDSERRRMAHEIHDGVAQSLAALRFKSALWHRLADSDPAGMHAALGELQNGLTAAIDDIRRAIFALRPVDLDALGFFAALTKWVTGFSLHNQLTVQLNIHGPQENLPALYELPLFRVIQEAVTNIRQHARAGAALVDLTVDTDGGVAVTVSDDGQGFDPAQLGTIEQATRFGLPQMRERILELSGTMNIRSRIGHGTAVVINLPPVAKQGRGPAYQGPERRSSAARGTRS